VNVVIHAGVASWGSSSPRTYMHSGEVYVYWITSPRAPTFHLFYFYIHVYTFLLSLSLAIHIYMYMYTYIFLLLIFPCFTNTNTHTHKHNMFYFYLPLSLSLCIYVYNSHLELPATHAVHVPVPGTPYLPGVDAARFVMTVVLLSTQ
jgi:hypothetical protein